MTIKRNRRRENNENGRNGLDRWERNRRNTLLKVKVKVDKSEVTQERDDSEEREAGLFLIDFKQS